MIQTYRAAALYALAFALTGLCVMLWGLRSPAR